MPASGDETPATRVCWKAMIAVMLIIAVPVIVAVAVARAGIKIPIWGMVNEIVVLVGDTSTHTAVVKATGPGVQVGANVAVLVGGYDAHTQMDAFSPLIV